MNTNRGISNDKSQRAMERHTLGASPIECIRVVKIRRQSKVIDAKLEDQDGVYSTYCSYEKQSLDKMSNFSHTTDQWLYLKHVEHTI